MSLKSAIDSAYDLGWRYDGVQKGLDDEPYCYNFTDVQHGSPSHGMTVSILLKDIYDTENILRMKRQNSESTDLDRVLDIIDEHKYGRDYRNAIIDEFTVNA